MKDFFYKFKEKSPRTVILLDNPILKGTVTRELLEGNFQTVPLPLDLYYLSGKKWTDILHPNRAAYFVSENFINLLKDNNLTGWKTYDLRIWNKNNEEVKGYYGFSVTGRCHNNLKTITIDKTLRGWDGSDFFIMRETTSVYMTINAFMCLDNKVTNSDFIPLSKHLTYY